MAKPVLVKQTLTIALLTGVQTVLPVLVAVAAFYAMIVLTGETVERDAAAIVIVACLLLLQAPREIGTQLTSQLSAAVAHMLVRWLLMFLVLVGVDWTTRTLDYLPQASGTSGPQRRCSR